MAAALEGVRIVDITTAIAGPMCTQILADQGADVIKVESETGDFVRTAGPRKGALSAIFIAINRNKRSIVLDLKAERGQAILSKLLAGADVLVQNLRPGAMEKLGFDWLALQRLNRKLIYAAISGYGQKGPYAKARVYDPLIQASSGIASTQRHPLTNTPSLVHSYVCDKLTALTAAQAICAALYARAQSGIGQMIELSMLEASLAFMWPDGMWNHTFVEPEPSAPDLSDNYRLMAAADGYVAVVPTGDAVFRALDKAFGLSEVAKDPRFETRETRNENLNALQEVLAVTFRQHKAAAIMDAVIAEGGAAARVNERHELFDDPQIRHDGSLVELDCGRAGRVRAVRHPARFSRTPAKEPGGVPELGQHTDEILAELGVAATPRD